MSSLHLYRCWEEFGICVYPASYKIHLKSEKQAFLNIKHYSCCAVLGGIVILKWLDVCFSYVSKFWVFSSDKFENYLEIKIFKQSTVWQHWRQFSGPPVTTASASCDLTVLVMLTFLRFTFICCLDRSHL